MDFWPGPLARAMTCTYNGSFSTQTRPQADRGAAVQRARRRLLFRPKDSIRRVCSDPVDLLVGDNTVTTLIRTSGRCLVLASIVTVAGCSGYDNPKQATNTEATPAVVEPATPAPTEVAAASRTTPARKLPVAALTAADQATARQALREANIKDNTVTRGATTQPGITTAEGLAMRAVLSE